MEYIFIQVFNLNVARNNLVYLLGKEGGAHQEMGPLVVEDSGTRHRRGSTRSHCPQPRPQGWDPREPHCSGGWHLLNLQRKCVINIIEIKLRKTVTSIDSYRNVFPFIYLYYVHYFLLHKIFLTANLVSRSISVDGTKILILTY